MLDPVARVSEWLQQAQAADPSWYNAMNLATVGRDGQPSSRMVLLKDFDERGFVFYSNLHSRKGREILGDSRVALCFHWSSLQRQLRIEGRAEQVETAEADAYFALRPRGSQIGAWASDQSAPLESRDQLLAAVAETERRYAGAPVPRPPHWTGLLVRPDMIEFWQGEPDRLHRRDQYVCADGGWSVRLLSP